MLFFSVIPPKGGIHAFQQANRNLLGMDTSLRWYDKIEVNKNSLMIFPAKLTVNLSAIRANFCLLRARHAKQNIAAVVKANAYGLGVAAVSAAIWDEGGREFFVATLEEAVELRGVLPQAKIYVFQGIFSGEEAEFTKHRLIPVLNSLEQVEKYGRGGEIVIHIDTGMTRLGLCETDLSRLPSFHKSQSILIISHLACANNPEHPKNIEQLTRLRKALALFPSAKVSFANSSGLFLSEGFHFDLGRPGCALYGINPTDGQNPMQQVATLCAPILQIRELDRAETVGYSATYAAQKGSRIAVVGMGYADGYFRHLSNQGFVYIAGYKSPVLGRVSMDMVAVDVSKIHEAQLSPETRAEFINAEQTVDDVANQANTIGYEVFTRIGQRVKREYVNSVTKSS